MCLAISKKQSMRRYEILAQIINSLQPDQYQGYVIVEDRIWEVFHYHSEGILTSRVSTSTVTFNLGDEAPFQILIFDGALTMEEVEEGIKNEGA